MIEGDCRTVLPALVESSFDSVVTDPPYGLEFMGKEWDSFGKAPTGGASFSPDGMGKGFKALPSFTGSPNPICEKCGGSQRGNDRKGFKRCRCENPVFPNTRLNQMRAFQGWCSEWAVACLRVLKPGGYAAIFGGTRTYHRLACAVEDAGFEIRDCLMWLYGTGFPKGQGCLKPAWEPILLCRKPGKSVLPLGIDACRVETAVLPGERRTSKRGASQFFALGDKQEGERHNPAGRYPANVVHDGSDEVLEAFAAFGEKTSGKAAAGGHKRNAGTTGEIYGGGKGLFPGAGDAGALYGDTGTAARFYFCAKASKRERGEGNTHPTVKPRALVRWLVRLVTPPGGTVLDPFAGSGTTLLAAHAEGRAAVGIEQNPDYCAIARARLAAARKSDGLFAEDGP